MIYEGSDFEGVVHRVQQRSYPKVQGKCPAGCGETLFLGAEGFVTCSLLGCPDPEAATKLLERGKSA